MLQNQSLAWPTPQPSQAERVLLSELPLESNVKQLTLRVAHLEADLLHLQQRKLDLEKENEEFAAADQVAKVQLAEALAENQRLEALLAEKSSEDRKRCKEFEAQQAEVASSISELQSIFEQFTKMLAENELGTKLWRKAKAKHIAASVRHHADKHGHLDSSSPLWDRAVRLRLGSESARSTPTCPQTTTASRSSPYTSTGRPQDRPKSQSNARQRHGALLQPDSRQCHATVGERESRHVRREARHSLSLPSTDTSAQQDEQASADLNGRSEGIRPLVANAEELASTSADIIGRASNVKKMVENYETQVSLRVQDPVVDSPGSRGICQLSRAVDTPASREQQSQATTPSCVKHQEFDKVYDALEREAKRDDLLVDRSFRQDLADARRYLRQGQMEKFPCVAEILTDWSNAFDKIKDPTSSVPFDTVRRELEEVREALGQAWKEGKATP